MIQSSLGLNQALPYPTSYKLTQIDVLLPFRRVFAAILHNPLHLRDSDAVYGAVDRPVYGTRRNWSDWAMLSIVQRLVQLRTV